VEILELAPVGACLWESLKTPPGFLERTKNEKRRFRFSSKSKPCGFDFGWHIHVPMVFSKNQGFFEVPLCLTKNISEFKVADIFITNAIEATLILHFLLPKIVIPKIGRMIAAGKYRAAFTYVINFPDASAVRVSQSLKACWHRVDDRVIFAVGDFG
jgi:hypothetical protein